MDGDGKLEIFVGGRVVRGEYPRATSCRIFRQHNGKLVPDVENNQVLKQVGLTSAATWGDLDADGWPELVLACEWDPIRVFHNAQGKLREVTQEYGLDPLRGWWNGVAVGDIDEDGRLDIIASNWGLNDTYRASREHAFTVYYGDLSNLGHTDLVEARWDAKAGMEVPLRKLQALGQAFPALMARYPTHAAFGKASVKEILSGLPRQPHSVNITTLASLLLLNRGRSFEKVELPVEAQFAPAFGVNIADANGDGNEDVFLSQNFFSVRPESDRLDAGRGLWLLGNGRGKLTALPGQDSGVEVYGEQRGSAVGDFNQDGRVDLLVSQNSAAFKLYENIGARPGLRVRLWDRLGIRSGSAAWFDYGSGIVWDRRGRFRRVQVIGRKTASFK
jgi:hypothetical protein